jgi:SPP1 gp7 family putative phage head morphogenesis protein
LYNDYCQTCEALNLSLNSDKTLLDKLAKAVEDAYKKLHTAGKYGPKDVTNYKDLIDATNDVFTKALEKGVADNVIPGAMKMALEKDVFLFSGLKTHAQLFEASRLLLDENKNVKPFSKFSKDIESIKANYNQNYLEAEYIFAQTSAQMAAKWNDVTQNGDRYNIQYRTAGDEKVRESHRVLDQITLPASDAFWNQYYPPNGWRCRCDAVEVLNSKYDKSDSKEAIKSGEKATSLIGKDGKNRLEIFRFNPGKEKVIFPPKHPYSKVMGSSIVNKLMKKALGKKTRELKTIGDLNVRIAEFSKKYPEYFARGFKTLKFETRAGNNGSTDMNGTISLKKDRINNIIDAFNNIEQGKKTTFDQEDAISTLHHEFWHNASKPGNMRLTPIQTRFMELSNEFVSRKTLKSFMQKIGGELQNEVLTSRRLSTGYNTMVENYQNLIKWAKCDESGILNDVKKYLIEEKYSDQLQGLVNAIENNSEFKIQRMGITNLVKAAKGQSEETFKKILEENEKLLIKK